MAWDFETDPEFQEKLDWMNTFVREECELVARFEVPLTPRDLDVLVYVTRGAPAPER